MKTRSSIAGKDDHEREERENSNKGSEEPNKNISPPYIRKLRSRVITSDTEEDAQVRCETPKLKSRKPQSTNESEVSDNNQVTTPAPELDYASVTMKTLKRPTRLSCVDLFRIEEAEDENNEEECKEKMKEEESMEDDFREGSITNKTVDFRDNTISTDETAKSNGGEVKEETASPDRKLKNVSMREIHTVAKAWKKSSSMVEERDWNVQDDDVIEERSRKSTISPKKASTKRNSAIPTKEEVADVEEKELIMNKPTSPAGDSDSGDEMPEVISFNSSKDTVNVELSKIAEAIRKEKEKRKEKIRRRMEMIKIQKAEKEEKRKQKLKLLETSIPERLAKDFVSSLPDVPEIPTVVNSQPKVKKQRKNEDKTEIQEPSKEERKQNKIVKFDDYIPITDVEGSTNFGVVPLEVMSHIPKSSCNTAAHFKFEALYGSRIQREPSKNLLIYRQKVAAAQKLQKMYSTSGSLRRYVFIEVMTERSYSSY